MENSLVLPDGRRLAFAEYGDPNGRPVFFFHGSPGSRLFRPPDEITRKLAVRLIASDRPGYGGSDFQPRRRIVDWPADITRLADHLALQKFAVAGHSGGGPYVLACADRLGDRISSATVISGAGPIDSPIRSDGMSATNRFGISTGWFMPWQLWRGLVWIFFRRRSLDPAAEIERGSGHRPAGDDEQIHKPVVRQTCIDSEVEAFRPGLRGLAWDVRLLTRPWGIRLDEIRLPVTIWHGTEDDQVPLAMARVLAGKIPGCKLTICDHEAHLLLFPHWEEILTQLTAE